MKNLELTDNIYEDLLELKNHASKAMDFGFIIDNTNVQILPTSIHPLFESALKHAKLKLEN